MGGGGRAGRDAPVSAPTDAYEQEAREAMQLRLSAISLVLWLIVAFGLVVLLTTPHESRPSQYLQIGGVALALAGLPWLGYRRWVLADANRRRARADPTRTGSAP